jgi:tetratricopeptide (TPR) repeat protein
MRAQHVMLTILLCALPACKATPARPNTAASNDEAAVLERGLAMQPLDGDTAADRLVAQSQGRVTRDPQKLDAWIRLAHAWIRKARETSDPGFYQNAEACASIALRIAPDSALALDVRGLALLNDHRFEEARQLATDILAKRPDDVTALGTLSDALLELGRYDEATTAAQKMVSIKPNLPSYSRASYLLWLKGERAAAKAVVLQAIDAAGDAESRAWVLVQAATYFWQEGDWDGADAGFDQALASFASFPPALVGKGRVALARGRAADAARAFARAYEASPLVETAWLLGDARERAGDQAGATAAYALVTQTGRADPRTLALFLASKDRDHAQALQLADAERRTRDDIYTEDVYAWALYRAGRLADARAASDKALALGTLDPRLRYHAGAIRLAQGDESGRQLVREALALNARFDPTAAEDARQLLASR